MKSKNLLTQLSDLENSLNNFSFEELSADEASRLQRSFLTFKNQLEGKVWGDPEVQDERTTSSQKVVAEDSPPGNEFQQIALVCQHMRTPLNGIIGLADLLMETRLNRDQAFQLDALRAATKGLVNMVNELTEFSSLHAGLETFEIVPFHIHNLVEDVKYLCETLIVDNRLKLTVVMDPAIPKMLSGDPSKLSQVLLHLLGNTLKKVHVGQIRLDVQFIHQEGEKVFLEFQIGSEVSGKASGNHPATLSVNPSVSPALQKTADTGLGLPIVHQIIEKLGGELHTQEERTGAAFFAFRLPFTKAASQITAGKHRQTEPLQGLRVVVFEDNPLNRQVMERRLNSWGCTPLQAENGLYGLQLLVAGQIDLVILDLKAESYDSLEITSQIRGHESESVRKLPIIALGSQLSEADIQELHARGISDIIQKPYGAEELHSILSLYSSRKPVEPQSIPSTMNGETEAANTLREIDLKPILEDCLGNMETLHELVALYKQKAMEFVGSVKLHLDRSDFKGIAFSCQKISSSLKLLRTENLLSLVEQMYKTSKTNQDLKHLKFLHHCFIEEYPRVESAIDEALAKLSKRKN